MAIAAATNLQNNRGGNGRYMPLRRQRRNPKQRREYLQATLELMDKRDLRTRFRSSKDPVFVAFDFVDQQSLGQLAVEFVKDSIWDIANFVSKTAEQFK